MRDGRSSSYTERFLQSTLLMRSGHFINADLTLLHTIPPVTRKREYAVARDSCQNSVPDGRSNHNIIDHKHHIHGSRFFNETVVARIGPDDLLVTALLGELSREQGAAVIAGCFHETYSTLNGTYVTCFHQHFERGIVVCRHRRCEDDELVRFGRLH